MKKIIDKLISSTDLYLLGLISFLVVVLSAKGSLFISSLVGWITNTKISHIKEWLSYNTDDITYYYQINSNDQYKFLIIIYIFIAISFIYSAVNLSRIIFFSCMKVKKIDSRALITFLLMSFFLLVLKNDYSYTFLKLITFN